MADLPKSSPALDKRVQNIVNLAVKGYNVAQISSKINVPEYIVRDIWAQEEFKNTCARAEKKIISEALRHKIPLLEEIASLSLQNIRDWLLELKDEDIRKAKISKISDVKALSDLLKNMNEMLRLEKGESTENVSTVSRNYQETRVVLQELSKKDPVFDYPALPNSAEVVSES